MPSPSSSAKDLRSSKGNASRASSTPSLSSSLSALLPIPSRSLSNHSFESRGKASASSSMLSPSVSVKQISGPGSGGICHQPTLIESINSTTGLITVTTGASVNLPETLFNEMAWRILSLFGLNLRDAQITQYAEGQEKEVM